jgi:hypothetical protein
MAMSPTSSFFSEPRVLMARANTADAARRMPWLSGDVNDSVSRDGSSFRDVATGEMLKPGDVRWPESNTGTATARWRWSGDRRTASGRTPVDDMALQPRTQRDSESHAAAAANTPRHLAQDRTAAATHRGPRERTDVAGDTTTPFVVAAFRGAASASASLRGICGAEPGKARAAAVGDATARCFGSFGLAVGPLAADFALLTGCEAAHIQRTHSRDATKQ